MDAIRRAGLHLVALHPERFLGRGIRNLIAEQPRGVVMMDFPGQTDQTRRWAEALRDAGIATVLNGGSPELEGFDRVVSDHEAGAYQLANWLVAQGRRRILPLWVEPGTGYWFPQRQAGYERAMREAGLPVLAPLIMPNFPECKSLRDFEAGSRLLAGYLIEYLNSELPVDAIMAATDNDVFGVAAACRLFGKNSDDVAVVGYDDYWRESPMRQWESAMPLATVDKRNREMGHELVQLLLERLDNQLPVAPQCRVVPPQLVITS
jgi:DNA-binding LacI/PurR family transcriptional regulator